MVNRFTPKAQIALTSAKKCSEKMGHSYIGTEHLVLGILSCDCVGKKALEDKKIFYTDVYSKLTEIAGVGTESPSYIRELTPKCKRIIENSSFCAKRFNSRLIGTEHMLYAICEEGDSVGGRILTSLGANLQILKNEIASLLDAVNSDTKPDKISIAGAPTLSLYGKNLNIQAKKGKCDPLIGRDKELDRLIQVLSRRTKNNPCLVGEAGVGKTAIVEGLAQRICEKIVPECLLDKTIVSLDLSSMIAGAKYRGEFEERMKNVLNELKSNDSLILFIDEIHTIIGAGAAEGAVDAANILKPSLARGEIQIIGATTTEEYRRYIEKEPSLERRFQPITVKEPSTEEAISFLLGLKTRYEEFHKVKIPPNIIEYAVNLSQRYITDRFLPDKAIDLIDEACSSVKMRMLTVPENIRSLEEELRNTLNAKEQAVLDDNFEFACELHEKEMTQKTRLDKMKKEREKHLNDTIPELSEKDIENVVTLWTSIPVSKPKEQELESLSNLEIKLQERVIGQKNAIKAVSSSIKRGRAGLKNPKKPVGTFLFLGPTGVGKTELAKAVAASVFGSEGNLIRLDMSEYTEKHSVSKLIGSPPGYVGYEDGGILTKAVKQKPYSVVLFDEIEKAHPDIYNILLQILDEGVLCDSNGHKISFKNTVLILTSNIGAMSVVEPHRLGFCENGDKNAEYKEMKNRINDELKRVFNPEFLNRLDEIVVFEKLSIAHTEEIACLMLKEVTNLCKEIGIDTEFDKSVSAYIAKKSFDKQYGARPLRRAIMNLIENPFSEKILSKEIKKGDRVSVFCENNEIKFKCYNNI